MEECLSDNQIAALVSGHAAGASSDDLSRLEAHLDGCPRCLTIVAAALRAEAPAADSRFAIVRRLGSGGMGTVYEALDRAHNTRVALKVLRHVAPDTILRFKREFRALSGVRHPNLVRRGELLGDDDRWCFTMELLDGVRFLDFVRPGAPAGAPGAPGFDDARLRDAFRQLVHGLAALHADGKVHRDVKPSNVLVTAQGRVVLIDLGLVLDQRGDSESSGGNALGTVAYMAPEQALGKRVGPEADLYAAGVLLYQALTGELPFAGDPLAIVERKQRGELVEPRLCVPALAAPWNELCVALLHPAPGARPTVAEILRALDASAPPAPIALPCAPAPEAALPFIGRADQLHALRRALDDTRGGQPVVALVAGDAGLGKTALVQWFAAGCRERGAVVLAGRCDARESLPFKAIDGIVDALSRYLARLPAIEVAAVLPRDAALLARTFPVLA
ncbi:MAG TPA: serine/threonine-protein kinase, partial [Kofleriaceae bacterium]|nr:serine/threonine-protein kinase [Kofleriaceae bacterium]